MPNQPRTATLSNNITAYHLVSHISRVLFLKRNLRHVEYVSPGWCKHILTTQHRTFTKASSAPALTGPTRSVDSQPGRPRELVSNDGNTSTKHARSWWLCWWNVRLPLVRKILEAWANQFHYRFMAASKVLGEETVKGGSTSESTGKTETGRKP